MSNEQRLLYIIYILWYSPAHRLSFLQRRIRSPFDSFRFFSGALPDVPAPAAQHLDDLGRYGHRDGDANEHEGFMDCVGEG